MAEVKMNRFFHPLLPVLYPVLVFADTQIKRLCILLKMCIIEEVFSLSMKKPLGFGRCQNG
jgi:hypothetical protein